MSPMQVGSGDNARGHANLSRGGAAALVRRILDRAVLFSRTGVLGGGIRVDASSVCQLKCPACMQSTGKRGVVSATFLRFEDFRELLDANPGITSVELSNWGEIFLNRDIKRIIACASQKGIELSASNGTNLNSIDDETITCLVENRFRSLLVSIDGASQETYALYRRGGNFQRVIENVRKINDKKRELGSPFPRLRWSFVVFGHNEHELPLARKMATDLGMEFVPVLNHFDPSFSPVRDKELVERETGLSSVEEFETEHEQIYTDVCFQLWFFPQIDSDGKLLGCCHNRWESYGNVFHEGLARCTKSERYRYAKEMVLGRKGPRNDIACTHCDRYPKLARLSNRYRLGRSTWCRRHAPMSLVEWRLFLAAQARTVLHAAGVRRAG